MTANAHAYARFRRAISRRNLWGAEDAARELRRLSLEDARHLVDLYAHNGSPKYDKAAVRWLARYAAEEKPSLDALVNRTLDLKRQAP